MDATAGETHSQQYDFRSVRPDQLDLHAKAARIAAKISLLEAEYRNAIALNPNDFRAYVDLSVILDHKGDSVGAHAAHADSYFALARLYEAKGDLKMAEIQSRYAKSIAASAC
jgi:Flp pilus assembly protein TadD